MESPATSQEEFATDDLLAVYRAYKAQRLRADTFTTQDLVAIAHQQGYTSLNEGMLRIWVHRGLFPQARTRLPAKGKPGLWYREDVVRLLDLCALNDVNNRGDAANLGLWLLGYDVPERHNAPNIRDLLVEQLARMERALYGQVIDRFDIDDVDLYNSIGDSINHAADEASPLDALCYRLRPQMDLENLQDLHPDGDAGASRDELEQATWLRHATDPDRPPYAATPEAAWQPSLQRLLRVLKQSVLWDIPPENAMKQVSDILRARFSDSVPPSRVTDEQLTELQRDIIAVALWDLSGLMGTTGTDSQFTLPALRRIVQEASDAELRQARLMSESILHAVLRVQHLSPTPAFAWLGRLGEQYHWDLGRLVAAPAFFPLTAYLIAAQVYDLRHDGPYILGHARSTRIRTELLPLALDQLARLTRESISRADAFLSVVLSVVPTAWLLKTAAEQEVNT
jgi:hypothetical protein